MKKPILLLFTGIFCLQILSATNLIQENFASGIPATWTGLGVTATTYSSKTCLSMSTNGYIITPALYKPGTLTFSHRASGNGKTLTVEKQINGGVWVVVGTVSPSSATTWGSSSMTINETNASVNIRFTSGSATIYISDVVITAGAKPIIQTSLLYINFTGLYYAGDTSASQSFDVSQVDLTADINITAPANFQISMNNTDFSGTANIAAGSGTTTVYTRYIPATAQGTETGNIELKSTGATSVKIFSITGCLHSKQPILALRQPFCTHSRVLSSQ